MSPQQQCSEIKSVREGTLCPGSPASRTIVGRGVHSDPDQTLKVKTSTHTLQHPTGLNVTTSSTWFFRASDGHEQRGRTVVKGHAFYWLHPGGCNQRKGGV